MTVAPSMPPLPTGLLHAIYNDKLVIFLGAGISRLRGCQSWKDLSNSLLKQCLDNGLIDNDAFECFSKLNDNKRKISISYHYLAKPTNRKLFDDIFFEALKPTKDINLYKNLNNLTNIFVTTNADHCIDIPVPDNNKVHIFNKNTILRNDGTQYVYHIHGIMDDPDSLVFTTSQYIRAYNNPYLQRFLKYLFNNYTVLFLGYGLAEFELLDYLIMKSNNKSKDRPDHYALISYTEEDAVLKEHDKYYYKDLNIEAIPYDIVEPKKYNIMMDIIESWLEQKAIIDAKLEGLKIEFLKKLSSDSKVVLLDTELRNRDIRTIVQKGNTDSVEALVDYIFSYIIEDDQVLPAAKNTQITFLVEECFKDIYNKIGKDALKTILQNKKNGLITHPPRALRRFNKGNPIADGLEYEKILSNCCNWVRKI